MTHIVKDLKRLPTGRTRPDWAGPGPESRARSTRGFPGSIVFVLVTLMALIAPPASPSPARAAATPHLWGERPLLAYFALTASLQSRLRSESGLSPVEWHQVRSAALFEADALANLRLTSERIIDKPSLTMAQKRLAIQRMGYNRRVAAIAYATTSNLQSSLPPFTYIRLVDWIERAWPEEVHRHGLHDRKASTVNGRLSGLRRVWDLTFDRFDVFTAPPTSARSYEIFATRYDSRGRYTAALPDQCLKLTNGGLKSCVEEGYIVGQAYSIIMSYKKSVGVDVAEAGPWNIDDNFWATLTDPTPRRMFADLPLGMPEAQAAFYNGYNGGTDQYGRKVTAPFAIDLAFKVADDLGLPPKANDWITVSMMWTDGWGVGGGGSGDDSQPAKVVPVETAPAAADGSIVHTVKSGQALWSIAAAYGVSVERLIALNGLNDAAVIVPGQELTVRIPGETASPPAPAGGSLSSPENDATATPDRSARRTQRADRQTAAAETVTPDPPREAQPTQVASLPLVTPSAPSAAAPGAAATAGNDPLLLAIAAAALVGLALIAWGTLATRRKL